MLIDMPVEELRTYRGSTPRPDDFDEFWDASLAESAALPMNAELIPAEFQAPCADCYDLFFDGSVLNPVSDDDKSDFYYSVRLVRE